MLREVLFPGFFGPPDLTPKTMEYHLGISLDRLARLLAQEVKRGFCFVCEDRSGDCGACMERSREAVHAFLEELPEIRRLLASDVTAAFEGDPAAKNMGEVIYCYPSIRAMTNHRIAYALNRLSVPLIPRIISEMAHAVTGIDIHPGASIGEQFFMDHGTGIVIGETSVIGRNVRIYQGVTLGAKSFPKDGQGRPVKGVKRHPIVEDYVTIYAGATILGPITIGHHAVIGGNVWVVDPVPPFARMIQGKAEEGARNGNGHHSGSPQEDRP